MTNTSAADVDANDTPTDVDAKDTLSDVDANDALPDVAEQIRSLTPSFEDVLKERFSAEARGAQNLTILLAALGIALYFGLIVLKKGKVAEIEFGFQSAKAGVILLSVTSLFFLIRFLFLAWRDSLAYHLKMFPAAKSMDDVAQSMHRRSVDLRRRAKEIADVILNEAHPEKIRLKLAAIQDQISKMDIEDLISKVENYQILAGDHSEEMRLKLSAIQDQISNMENYQQKVGNIIGKFVSRSRFIDKYTVAFEVTLPCLLVAALLALVIYWASKMIFLETV